MLWAAVLAAMAPAAGLAQRCPGLTGLATDMEGDALRVQQVNPSPDLISSFVSVFNGVVRFQVRFAPGTFNRSTTEVEISIDLDQNPATGDNSQVAQIEALTGRELILSMGSDANRDMAFGRPFINAIQAFSSPVMYVTDGIDTAVPVKMLGNDDGRLNFRIVARHRVPNLITNELDRMPNRGLAPGTTCSGGQIVDSTSDGSGAAELVFVRGAVEAGFLALSVRFLPGSFDRQRSLVRFLLDTDQNPARQEFELSMGGPINQNNATLIGFGAGGGARFPVRFMNDGMDTLIPLTALNDDGILDFRAFAQIQNGAILSAVLDAVPNAGLAPG
ncbi:MAG: hypothetical protein ACRD44_04355, partial [Bryobacteraceae bacterium]